MTRRLATCLLAIGVAAPAAGVAPAAAWADGAPPSSPAPSTTAVTLAPAPSTTAAPTTAAPTTAKPPATTAPATTAVPPPTPVQTTPPGSAPATTGVPLVPTGNGATTTTAPGSPLTPPPPPVDVGPIIDAVDADLDQLAAISGYAAAQQAVPAAQQQVTTATAQLTLASTARDATHARLATADARLATAKAAMAGLAIAAYTGEAYAVPGAASGARSDGTVAAPASGAAAGHDPDVQLDAGVMLGAVVDHTKRAFDRAGEVAAAARHDDDQAAAGVTGATAQLQAAEAGVTAAQAALAADVQAATTPGVAFAQQQATQLAAATHPGSGQRSTTSTTAPTVVVTGGPTVLGPSVLTAPELAAWFLSTGQVSNASVPVDQLTGAYLQGGQVTGVRADIAFAQSVIETGYFNFPAGGQLTGADNNFAGIGACDSCAHGWSFPDALTGVTAQMELLEAYASPTPVPTPLIGKVGVGGCCSTWTALAGTWASNRSYGLEILTLYKRMLDWAIPQRLLAVGLPAPAGTVPAPPGTEPTGPSAPQPGVPGPGAAPTTTAPAPASTTTTPGRAPGPSTTLKH